MIRYAIKIREDYGRELRDCPYCGGKPEWVVLFGDDWILRCSQCHTSTKEARMTKAEAEDDWNATEIVDDHYSIPQDTKLDEFLKHEIRQVYLEPCSIFDPFPEVEGGFCCEAVFVETSQMILYIAPYEACLMYDETGGYGECKEMYRSIREENQNIYFDECKWNNGKLLSVSFLCGKKKIIISFLKNFYCRVIYEDASEKPMAAYT